MFKLNDMIENFIHIFGRKGLDFFQKQLGLGHTMLLPQSIDRPLKNRNSGARYA
jgi:hypothetical protein